MINVLALLVSLIPSILIIIFIFKRSKGNKEYRKACKGALIRGLVCAIPIIFLSLVLYLVNKVIKNALNLSDLAYKAIYNFVVLAFAEEIIKYLCFRRTLKKRKGDYTWTDIVSLMVIVGTAFGLVEDIPYAADANAVTILVRGLTMGHVGYGFLMGLLYGKRLESGKKGYGFLALIIPWILHGMYDFSLTPELMDLNDNLIFIAISLAVLDIVLVIIMIRFYLKKKEKYQVLVCHNDVDTNTIDTNLENNE